MKNCKEWRERNLQTCRAKVKIYRYNRQANSRQIINDLKGKSGCYYCKEREPVSLQWHHIDPKTKSFTIGKMLYDVPIELILEEIKKCVCVCANCHLKLHNNLLPKPKIRLPLQPQTVSRRRKKAD